MVKIDTQKSRFKFLIYRMKYGFAWIVMYNTEGNRMQQLLLNGLFISKPKL